MVAGSNAKDERNLGTIVLGDDDERLVLQTLRHPGAGCSLAFICLSNCQVVCFPLYSLLFFLFMLILVSLF